MQLEMLKITLRITSDAINALLEEKIRAAKSYIADEGIVLLEPDDDDLVVRYAAFLYREVDMPKNLRLALNNRKIKEVASRDG